MADFANEVRTLKWSHILAAPLAEDGVKTYVATVDFIFAPYGSLISMKDYSRRTRA